MLTHVFDLLRMPRVLALLVLISTLPEVILTGADLGIWGTARWRPFAYENFAFWPGLLQGWIANYAAQPWTMFVSYALLHTGPSHMVVNMVTLILVGRSELARIKSRPFLLIYLVSALGGAAGYGLLSGTPQPMVGASGALFGLVGAWLAWDICDAIRDGRNLSNLMWVILWPLALLVFLNVVSYVATAGYLAWETHLGGFVAGAALAPFFLPKQSKESR